MRILAIGASSSSTSINRQFVSFAAHQFEGAEVIFPDLNDYEMPIYSSDREKESGVPTAAKNFKILIKQADLIMISFAEHNGSYSAAFKNIMDWMSRIQGDTWEGKPFFMMATSPGGRGGKTVLGAAVTAFKHMGAEVLGQFSLPSFYQNFKVGEGIINPELRVQFKDQLAAVEQVEL